jgi:aconitase B
VTSDLNFKYAYLTDKDMNESIPPIILPPAQNPILEGEWLQLRLHRWLDEEFIPEAVNQKIAQRAAQIFVRQRMEGENDLGSLVIAIVTEMQSFDFSKSFYGEFAIANAVSDLLLESLGIDKCCGQ